MSRGVALPCDNEEQWRRHLELFSHVNRCRDVKSLQTLLSSIARVANPRGQNLGVSGLGIFFKRFASPEETDRFFESTLPFIANLAASLKELCGGVVSIPLLNAGEERSISLKRSVVSSLLACGVLCAFPAGRHVGVLDFAGFYNCFNNLASNKKKSQPAKLRCIFHYFDRLKECGLKNITGHVIYSRRVLSDLPTLDWWIGNAQLLCTVEVFENGAIENCGEEALQVDFAARHVGGGVLRTGSVQEEIRFCINPELIVSMLFTEPMESHEAVVIRGTERFSDYAGYAQTLQFAGDYQDKSKCDDVGNLLTTIIAIDATNVKNLKGISQYSQDMILRELLKAYAGFSSPQPDLPVVPPSTTSADSRTAKQELMEFANQLVAGIMDEVKDSITASEQPDVLAHQQTQSLSDFADRQVAAIFQSVNEMSQSSPPPPTSVGEFSSSLVAGLVKSAPETAFIEQLRSSTAEKSVVRYVDRLVSEVISSALTEHVSEGAQQSLEDWAHHLVMEIIHSAIHSNTVKPGKYEYKAVATGNWGCGAFGGDPQLKSLIQWMAVSAAGRPAMWYYTYEDKRVAKLKEVTKHVTRNRWTVGDLMRALMEYSETYYGKTRKAGKRPHLIDMFDFVISR